MSQNRRRGRFQTKTPGKDAANPHSQYLAPDRKRAPEPTTGREQKSAKNRAGLGRERARGPAQEGLTPPLRPRPCAGRRSTSSPISKPEIPRAARAEERTRGELRFEVSQTPRLSGKSGRSGEEEKSQQEENRGAPRNVRRNSGRSRRNFARQPRASSARTTLTDARGKWPGANYEFVSRIRP